MKNFLRTISDAAFLFLTFIAFDIAAVAVIALVVGIVYLAAHFLSPFWATTIIVAILAILFFIFIYNN